RRGLDRRDLPRRPAEPDRGPVRAPSQKPLRQAPRSRRRAAPDRDGARPLRSGPDGPLAEHLGTRCPPGRCAADRAPLDGRRGVRSFAGLSVRPLRAGAALPRFGAPGSHAMLDHQITAADVLTDAALGAVAGLTASAAMGPLTSYLQRR